MLLDGEFGQGGFAVGHELEGVDEGGAGMDMEVRPLAMATAAVGTMTVTRLCTVKQSPLAVSRQIWPGAGVISAVMIVAILVVE